MKIKPAIISLADNIARTIVCNIDLASYNGVPTEVQLLPFGKWKGYRDEEGNQIEFEITRELALKAVAYHKKLKEKFPLRDYVIDYEHQSQDGGLAPAAGWFDGEIFLKDDGIWATVKSWTNRAKEFLINKEYRYGSPVFLLNAPDKETNEIVPIRFKSLTLTNTPFLDNYKPIIAKDDSSISTIIYLTDFISQPTKGDTTMLEQILQLLGLAAGATIEEVKRVIEGMKNTSSTVAAKYKDAMNVLSLKDDASIDDVKALATRHSYLLTELGIKPTDSLDAIKTVIVTAKEKGKTGSPTEIALTERVNTLTVALAERDFNDVIKKHSERGAVLPAEVEHFKADVVGSKISCKDLDVRLALRADNSMVPLGSVVAAKDKNLNDKIDENTLEIAGNLNVSKADLEKYGK